MRAANNSLETLRNHYDCVVIGGGPAGSTVANLVAQADHSVLLVERKAMPRFHVGESLMPETYWTFQRLGVLEKLRSSKFVRKYSVQFVAGSGKESAPFYFQDHDDRDCSATWQVERAEFDKLLFDHAAEQGAHCRDATRVTDVLFDGDRATGVRLQDAQGGVHEVACRVVADCTGQQALLANRLGLKQINPDLRKAAIWTYYRGALRDEGKNAGATIILHTREKKTWFWYIPLSDDITSVGVVGDNDYLLKGRGKPEQVYNEELAACPGLESRLMHAERVEKHHVAKEFSYTTRQKAGPGWVLVGDAYGFIDPIYSSGVFFALKTGEMAADSIVAGLQANDLSGETLSSWSKEFEAGMQLVRQLVHAYYNDGFSFGSFMKAHPEHQGNLTDLLIGRVFYDGAGRIFDDMQPWLDKAQAEEVAST